MTTATVLAYRAPPPELGVQSRQKGLSTLDEERRELLNAALSGLRAAPLHPDRAAACLYLLRHLALTSRH